MIKKDDNLLERRKNSQARSHTQENGHNYKPANAYMTVEASMVFVIALFMIVFVIQMWLFSYNRCVMEQNAALLAIRGSSHYYTSKSRTMEYLKDENTALCQENNIHIGWAEVDRTISLRGNKVWISEEGALFAEKDNHRWVAETKIGLLRLRPSYFIRQAGKIIEHISREDENGD